MGRIRYTTSQGQKMGIQDRGFTLVELLIVIVIISILAAITIVAYNGMQDRAHASTAQADAHQVANLLNMAYTGNGTYPNDLSTINNGGPMPTADGSTYTYHPGSGNASYCSTVTNGNHSYYIKDTAMVPTAGACPGDGVNGVAAITNLATNPSAEGAGGWYSNNGTYWPVSYSTSVFRSGTRSVSSTIVSGYASSQMLTIYAPGASDGYGIPISTTGTFTASIYFRADAANKGQIWSTYRLNGTYSSSTYGPVVTGSTTGWTRASVTFTVPSGADRIRLGVAVYTADGSNAVPGVNAYVDDVMLTQGSTVQNYADGNTSNWVWNGTANASTSTGPPQ